MAPGPVEAPSDASYFSFASSYVSSQIARAAQSPLQEATAPPVHKPASETTSLARTIRLSENQPETAPPPTGMLIDVTSAPTKTAWGAEPPCESLKEAKLDGEDQAKPANTDAAKQPPAKASNAEPAKDPFRDLAFHFKPACLAVKNTAPSVELINLEVNVPDKVEPIRAEANAETIEQNSPPPRTLSINYIRVGDKLMSPEEQAELRPKNATVPQSIPNHQPPKTETTETTEPPPPETDDEPILLPALVDKSEWSDLQKRRADYDAFGSWLERHRETVTGDKGKVRAGLRDEDKSSAALVREFESARIIESPRDYQIELFEKAKQKNIIAVLDTGSGKTLIAAMLLRHMVDAELEERAHGRPTRTAFFLVDKVALVFQQHAVLECNLSQPVAKFSGDRADLRWTSKDYWDRVRAEHMVIVCTADILLKALHHAYVGMDDISLLIFDEAHHAKKNHAYARIIKDFYPRGASADEFERRPKIFGMTASPVDARTDVTQAAQELESLLHAEIATIVHSTQLAELAKPKTERVVHYHTALRPRKTELTESLESLVGGHRSFARNFQYAHANHEILGPWLTDRFWQLLFRTEELAKQEARAGIEAALDLEPESKDDDDDPNVAAVRAASRLVQTHAFDEPRRALVSNKVQRLHDVLHDAFTKSTGDATRCIVFVEQRYTALLLADLFAHAALAVPNMRTGVLIGGASTDMGRNSFRTQLLTISRFKQGAVNCLFATSVAEEGLDIPDCNLVVRFDLYRTMIQYVQSRGRARHHASTYVHMAELGNAEHARVLAENRASEDKMRAFCNALPDDRKIGLQDIESLDSLDDEPVYVVPSTQAKLTYRSALVIVEQFVSTLPEPSEGVPRAQYAAFATTDGFVYEVTLPSSSPVRFATGQPHRRKQVAKCAAAFALCLKLYAKKYLDRHLQPVFASKLPAMRNARLAVSSKKQALYPMRAKPEAWSRLGRPDALWAALVVLTDPASLGRPSRPVVLLTREPLPPIPAPTLFFGADRKTHVRIVSLPRPLVATDDELAVLTGYTIGAFLDVFSKHYSGEAADMPYFFAPSTVGHVVDLQIETRDAIDWAVARDVAKLEVQGRTGDEPDKPDAWFRDKFVADPFDGSRKFFTVRVRRDLSPFDAVPEGVPPPGHRAWNRPSTVRNIVNYSVSLWSKSRATTVVREDQPVVEAELVRPRRALADLDAEQSLAHCFLVLDTLRVSAIPVDTVAMLMALPPIVFRIESTLIALEATRALGVEGILPALALEAVTKDADATDDRLDASEGPSVLNLDINSHMGTGANYERLELLGDSFLKMATTIALYTLVPDKNEFEYHVARMCMVCNQNLFNNALDMGLEAYVRTRPFGRAWYPAVVDAEAAKETPATHGITLKRGKKQVLVTEHALGDKSLADVCEALIGAAYLSTYATHDLDLAVRTVSAVVKSPHHPMTRYDAYYEAYRPPEWQTQAPTAAQTQLAQIVARDVGHVFRWPRLLRSAVTHPSYPRLYENLPSYQRLEFLGDALFDMAAVDYLFHAHPDKDPQWLTEHKMAMVSNQFLGALAVSLNFHRHLLSFTGDLQRQVTEYAVRIEEARTRAEDEAEAAGRPRSAFARDYWVAVTRPVKVVADVLEAYVGAIFVDSGYDYHGTVLPFFRRHVLPYFADMTLYDTFANKHPVTFAVNLLSVRFGCRDWRAVVQETPDTAGDGCVTFATKIAAGFLVHGRVLGHGIADSGRYAKIAAAKQALGKLDSLDTDAFQALTGCTCKDDV